MLPATQAYSMEQIQTTEVSMYSDEKWLVVDSRQEQLYYAFEQYLSEY